jgi:hypothetical protein
LVENSKDTKAEVTPWDLKLGFGYPELAKLPIWGLLAFTHTNDIYMLNLKGWTNMLAISLHQPWASMIAASIKRFETRAYPPPKSFEIGGWIAIHAAKKRIADSDLRLWTRKHSLDPDGVPYGAIVCVARITGVYQMGDTQERVEPSGAYFGYMDVWEGSKVLTEKINDEFGDYSSYRWAWLLEDIILPEKPIPERGRQKFWEWESNVGL